MEIGLCPLEWTLCYLIFSLTFIWGMLYYTESSLVIIYLYVNGKVSSKRIPGNCSWHLCCIFVGLLAFLTGILILEVLLLIIIDFKLTIDR